MSYRVSEERLRADITTNAEFGSIPAEDGVGRTVLPGTEANGRARTHLVEQLERAGLDVRIDPVGNIAGRWVPENADPTCPAIACGGHLDSVPEGGMFDGVLGVYGALEAVRALQEADLNLRYPIEVICFTGEEGSRFAGGVLGSSVAGGGRTTEAALALEDAAGVSLAEALAGIGFDGNARIDASAWDSWIELHVEQGTRLENAAAEVGIVTAITGTIRCLVEITGEANHAGTTPMAERTDALAAASELVLEVEAIARELAAENGGTAVGTVGHIECAPNAINVVPGIIELGIDIRDIDYLPMEAIAERIAETLSRLETERGVTTSLQRSSDIEPVVMDDRIMTALSDGASVTNTQSIELYSGAGHDAMALGNATAVGMLFAPSCGGYSHSPLEWTDWDDCATATRVLAVGLARLATA